MSPLAKRLPRELKSNLGKYLGIFFLLVVIIAFGAGFLSAIESINALNRAIPERYAVEDGRFTANFEADDEALDGVRDLGVEVYENFSYDLTMEGGSEGDAVVRVHRIRDQVDLAHYFEGHAPTAADEIALNKNYCENNGLSVGDEVQVAGKPMTICATITLPDYISSFQSNTDLMFNSVTFCVAEVSDAGYAAFAGEQEAFAYSFTFDGEALNEAEQADLEEDMAEALSDAGVVLTDFIDADANQGIMYAAEDQEGDAVIMTALVMLVVLIVAFVFAVLILGTIADESAIIGTLLASGYRKREIILHYLSMPALVGVAGAVVGNAIGYGFMVDFVVGIYGGSYAYPPIETVFSWGAFLMTTVVPLVLLVGITCVALLWKMRLTPLRFLRHDLTRTSRRHGVKLPEALSFPARFRLRAILCNVPNYLVLGFGVLFASILFLFGAGLLPSIQSYAELTVANMPAAHQYVLKTPVELEGTSEEREQYAALVELSQREDADDIDFDAVADLIDVDSLSMNDMMRLAELTSELSDELDESADELSARTGDLLDELLDFADEESLDAEGRDLLHHARLIAAAAGVDEDAPMVNTYDNDAAAIAQAEKFATYSLEAQRPTDHEMESISVYGIQEDSAYYADADVSDGRVVVGQGFAEKFGLRVSDTFTLDDKYDDETHTFTVAQARGNTSDVGVYMSLDDFNAEFDNDPDYYGGYLSNEALDIESTWLASDIDEKSITGYVDQMMSSFYDIMGLFNVFAMCIYLILMYLLTKTIIERSARYISYLKVFGYTDREVSQLYVRSITLATVAFLVVSVPLAGVITEAYCNVIFASYAGHIVMTFPLWAYAAALVTGLACYAVVAWLHVRRIKRVPLALALKVQE